MNLNQSSIKMILIEIWKESVGFTCPECGSKNTGQSVKVDWCNDCGWSYTYP